MDNDNYEKRIRVLYKDLIKSNKLDEQDCKENISILKEIKEDLISDEKIYEEDFDEISLGCFWGDIVTEDISSANKEMLKQLQKIAKRLGIDLDEQNRTESQKSHVINNYLYQNQSQSQEMNVNIEINNLLKEFEDEIKKRDPDKTRLKNLLIKIAKFGSIAALKILGLIIKYWDKFKFAGGNLWVY